MTLNDYYVLSLINGCKHCGMTIERFVYRTSRRQIESPGIFTKVNKKVLKCPKS